MHRLPYPSNMPPYVMPVGEAMPEEPQRLTQFDPILPGDPRDPEFDWQSPLAQAEIPTPVESPAPTEDYEENYETEEEIEALRREIREASPDFDRDPMDDPFSEETVALMRDHAGEAEIQALRRELETAYQVIEAEKNRADFWRELVTRRESDVKQLLSLLETDRGLSAEYCRAINTQAEQVASARKVAGTVYGMLNAVYAGARTLPGFEVPRFQHAADFIEAIANEYPWLNDAVMTEEPGEQG